MKNAISNTFKTLKKVDVYSLFSITLFLLVITYLAKVVLLSSLNFILSKRGYLNYNYELLKYVFSDPITIIIVIIFYSIFALLVFYAIYTCFYLWIKQAKSNNLRLLITEVFNSFKFIFKDKPLVMVLYFILFMPAAALFDTQGFTSIISIPFELIANFEYVNFFRFCMYVVLIYINIRLIFVLCYLLENQSKESIIKKSWSTTKHLSFKIFLGLLVISIGPALIYELSTFISSILLNTVFTLVADYPNESSILLLVIQIINTLIRALSNALLLVMMIIYISNFFYSLNNLKIEIKTSKLKINHKLLMVSCIVIVIIFLVNINYKVNAMIEKNKPVKVIAHRGSSSEYVENTIDAFKQAVIDKADLIELDVHITKDQELVVMHDSNIKRVTGINKKTTDLTNKDLETITYLNDKKQKIPTLEETMKTVDNKNALLIELKSTAKNNKLEEKVNDLILKYNLSDNVYVHSQSLSACLKIKALNPKIKVGHIIPISLSKYPSDYNKLDFFSIRAKTLEYKQVDALIKKDKQLFIWTINSKTQLEDILRYKINGVISDYPKQIREYLNYYNDQSNLSLIKRLFF